MGSRSTAVPLILSLAVLAAACAQPPTERVDAAKQRLEAVAAEAAVYAPGAYKAAQDAAAQLDAELAAQEGRFAPSYERTGELAAALEAALDKVQPAIAAEQDRLRTETGRLVADAKRGLADAQQALEGTPGPQIPEERRAAWRSEAAGVETSLGEVDKLLAGGQLTEARRRAEAAAKAAMQVTTAVAEAQREIQAAREAAAERAARGDVTIPRAVLVDGQPLGAGEYSLRLGEEVRAPSGATQRWVEFVRSGSVAGRALAVAISDAEIREVAESPAPRNEVRVDSLRGGEYVRVWLNRGGTNYLLHLPPQSR
jgi:colicin import membrane protein